MGRKAVGEGGDDLAKAGREVKRVAYLWGLFYIPVQLAQ